MKEMDSNHDGKISYEEFKNYHKKINSQISKSEKMLKAKFNSIDRDRNGYLDFDELVEHSLYEWHINRREIERKNLNDITDQAQAESYVR